MKSFLQYSNTRQVATAVGPDDILLIVQGGVVKQLPASLLAGGGSASWSSISKVSALPAVAGSVDTALTGLKPLTKAEAMVAYVRMTASQAINFSVEIWEGAVLKYQFLNIQQAASDDAPFSLHFSQNDPVVTLRVINNGEVAADVTVEICGTELL